nr:lysozyme inhibitor LprI family protein [Celeribacter sp. PS-C1]
MTQSAMNACAHQGWVKADEDLNDTYTWAMARARQSGDPVAEALRTAQRAWIPYRDAACEAEGILFEGGTIQPLIVYTCLEHLTRQRTNEMRAVYEMN